MSDFCNPMDYIVHGILQARILQWWACPFSRGSSPPRDLTQVSHTAGGFFTSWATREAQDCSPPGSSVHRILQARILEWAAIPFSWGSPWPATEPRSPALQTDSLPPEPPGNPNIYTLLCTKQITNENWLYSTGNYAVFCDYLNGKDIQKRGDRWICIVDLLCRTAESNTTL